MVNFNHYRQGIRRLDGEDMFGVLICVSRELTAP